MIIIRRVGSALSSTQPTQNNNECIQSWVKIIKSIQAYITAAREDGTDQINHEVTNAVCFMVRVLHLYIELRGPDLGSNAVDTIFILFDLAVVGIYLL